MNKFFENCFWLFCIIFLILFSPFLIIFRLLGFPMPEQLFPR